MNDAQRFIQEVRAGTIRTKQGGIYRLLTQYNAIYTGQYQENRFFTLPDRSRVIANSGHAKVPAFRAAPPLDEKEG